MPCPADSWRTQPVSRLRLLGLELGFGHYSARAMASARITNGGKRDDEGDDAGKDWKVVIADEYARRSGVYAAPDETSFPLIASSIFSEEILAAVDSMLNGQLTMANNVREFERAFATYVGAPFAVMCNSGSSANLLALAALTNHLRSKKLSVGDEVLIPAVCWSTSLWPIIQMGLVPVFVDVDVDTMNVDLDDLEARITDKTRGVLAVHVLGSMCDMDRLIKICTERDLLLVEDTCESLGSTYGGKYVGTFGNFGSYSFYFSHHITTGEGGMVVCQTQEDADLVRCLRAHGWTRELSNKDGLHEHYAHIDSRFMFVNVGYNLRPMEISGAIGKCQLLRLDSMNANRKENRERLLRALKTHEKWNDQFRFPSAPNKCADPAWFGFVAVLRRDLQGRLPTYLEFLTRHKVENRPIISGNFVHQPAIQTLGLSVDPKGYPGSDELGTCGFFIGVHTYRLSDAQISYLADTMLAFDFANAAHRKVVLVTGGSGLVGRALEDVVKGSEGQNDDVWIFSSSKDADLRSYDETKMLFKRHCPTHVLHLAVKLMAGSDMSKMAASLIHDNDTINANVLRCAHEVNCDKVVSVLSSFAYPERVELPIDESQLHAGPCHPLYESYGSSKRTLEILSRAYRAQYGRNFVTVIPSNIFGAISHLREDGPVIDALVSKAVKSAQTGCDFSCRGTGAPFRQFCYAPDLAHVLVWALGHYDEAEPINVAGEEISIRAVTETIADIFGVEGRLTFDASFPDGPKYRTLSDRKLRRLFEGYEQTGFKTAMQDVVAKFVDT
jgi:CDP-6-deoxy-D-xylo-4-hexulose-3-dehydrase